MTDMIPAWVDGELVPREKLQVHVDALRHKAVSIFILSGDQLLIQRRALGKYHTPGLWANTCCTHPNWDEQPLHCAIRRLQEELGIDGLTPDYRGQVEYMAHVGNGLVEHEVVDVFVATADQSLPMALNPEEVMEVRWIPLASLDAEIAEAPDRFTPWLRIYLEKHRAQILRT